MNDVELANKLSEKLLVYITCIRQIIEDPDLNLSFAVKKQLLYAYKGLKRDRRELTGRKKDK